MSFVNAQPEALAYAASKLEGIGSSVAAQNASAAAPTTGVVPAAADEVSALQATQFTAYGNLYQQVSAQATAINQAFVQMLGLSGDSYGTTEAANSAATASASLFSPLGQLTQFGQFGILPGALTNGSMIGLYGANPFIGSAANFMSLAQSQNGAGADSGGGAASAASAGPGELGGLSLAGAAAPAAVGAAAPAVGAAPVTAGVGQAATVGAMSVPPSWAGGTVATGAATPARLAGWTAPAAAHGAPVNTVPGGVPSMASGARTSGLGAPRYGVKPKVMPAPRVV